MEKGLSLSVTNDSVEGGATVCKLCCLGELGRSLVRYRFCKWWSGQWQAARVIRTRAERMCAFVGWKDLFTFASFRHGANRNRAGAVLVRVAPSAVLAQQATLRSALGTRNAIAQKLVCAAELMCAGEATGDDATAVRKSIFLGYRSEGATGGTRARLPSMISQTSSIHLAPSARFAFQPKIQQTLLQPASITKPFMFPFSLQTE